MLTNVKQVTCTTTKYCVMRLHKLQLSLVEAANKLDSAYRQTGRENSARSTHIGNCIHTCTSFILCCVARNEVTQPATNGKETTAQNLPLQPELFLLCVLITRSRHAGYGYPRSGSKETVRISSTAFVTLLATPRSRGLLL